MERFVYRRFKELLGIIGVKVYVHRRVAHTLGWVAIPVPNAYVYVVFNTVKRV